MNIGNQKAQNSKENILSALLELMDKESFSEITISQIAAEADVSRPTFYRNFTDKESVLEMKINDIITNYINQHNQVKDLSVQTIAPLLFETIIDNLRFFQLLVDNRLLYLFMEPLYKKLLEIHRTIRIQLWQETSEQDLNNFFSLTFGACEYFIRLHINDENPSVEKWTKEFTKAVKLLERVINH